MKINWGTKLTIVFILFAGGILYMVYRCVNIPVALVSSEYYKDEIAYQDVIDGTNNANNLSTKFSFSVNGSQLTLNMPQELNSVDVKVSILFYCSSNAGHDRHFEFKLSPGSKETIEAGKILPGNYVVKTNWWANSKHYYNEQPFTMQ